MHLFINILLTKIFNLMKKTELRVKALLFSVVFFFVGMAGLSAQYVEPAEAINILKGEIATLEDQVPGATNQQLVNLYFKINYFGFVRSDISEGSEVGAAITNNRPTGKLKLHNNGWVTAANSDPNVKIEIDNLVTYTQALLTD